MPRRHEQKVPGKRHHRALFTFLAGNADVLPSTYEHLALQPNAANGTFINDTYVGKKSEKFLQANCGNTHTPAIPEQEAEAGDS